MPAAARFKPVPLASLLGADALRSRLADSGARLVVTDAEGAERIRTLDGVPDLRWIVVTARDLPRLLEDASPRPPAHASTADEPCMIIYTSGTTGPPKGVLHGHRVLIGQASGFRMCHEFPPRRGDLMWTPADWAWIGGLVNTLLLSWLHGVPMIAAPRRGLRPGSGLALLPRLVARAALPPHTATRMKVHGEVPKGVR